MYVSPYEGGTVKIDDVTPSSYPASANFSNGTTIHIEAIPTAGYRFDSWNGDLTDNTNPAEVLMSCNKIITASFVMITHTLTVQVSGNGTTLPPEGTYTYYEGATVEINAYAGDGWYFAGWTGGVTSPDSANNTVIINSDMTIVANFGENTIPWPLIGGIIGSVAILVAVIFWPIKRRTKVKLSDSSH